MFKGILLHAVAKGMFVLGSYVLHFALGRGMSPAAYGIVGTIITIINFNYLFLQNGLRQGASKLIAQDEYDGKDVVKKGFLIQGVIILVIFSFNFFGSQTIANLLNDTTLVPYIRLTAWMIPFLGGYFACLGIMNGLGCFKQEAGVTSVYPILKLIVIPCALLWFADPVRGTIWGFFFAGAVICALSFAILFSNRKKVGEQGEKVPWKTYIKTVFGFSVLFIVVTIIMNVDTMILKSISGNNELVGFYTGAVTFSKAPYYLLNAFYLVVLPMVSKEYAKGETEKCRDMIAQIITVLVWIICPITIIMAVSSGNMLSLFYKPQFSAAALPMSLLMISSTCIGIMVVFCMTVSATGKKKGPALLAVGMLAFDVVLCIVLTKLYSASGTAAATALVALSGCIISGVMATKIFGNVFGIKTIKILGVYIVFGALFRIFFAKVQFTSLIALIAVYAVLYFASLASILLLRIVKVKEVMAILKK